jgi:drug/metabolite transporter (DMT)-like permease
MPLLGALLALGSAAVWGAGDFLGGLAVRRGSQLQVVALSAASGIVMLVALALLLREPLPPVRGLVWAAVAGLSGAVGIAMLYQGLAIGSAATVAPTAAVVAAALPVLFGAITEGPPGPSRLAGFALAIGGIWLVARTPSGSGSSAETGLRHGLIAGCGFGGFLILIAQVPPGFVFAPLATARSAALLGATLVMLGGRVPLPSPGSNPPALAAGLFDAAGTVFYVFAHRYIRLDVAAVLSSLYPVVVVVLARVVLKDPITATQWIGAGMCLAAVTLIAS